MIRNGFEFLIDLFFFPVCCNTPRATLEDCPARAEASSESAEATGNAGSQVYVAAAAGVVAVLLIILLVCRRRARLAKLKRRRYDVAPRVEDDDAELHSEVRLSTGPALSPSGSRRRSTTAGRTRPSLSRDDGWSGTSSNTLVQVDDLLKRVASSPSGQRQEGIPDDTAADFSAYQPGGKSSPSSTHPALNRRPNRLLPLVQGHNGSVAITSRTMSSETRNVTENFENNFSRLSHRMDGERKRQLEKLENLRAVRTHIAETSKPPLQRPVGLSPLPQRLLSPPATRFKSFSNSLLSFPLRVSTNDDVVCQRNSYDWEEEGFGNSPEPA